MNKFAVPGIVLVSIIAVLFVSNLESKSGNVLSEQSKNTQPKTTHTPRKVVQENRKYSLLVTSNINKIKPNQLTRITYKIQDEEGIVLRNFAVAHEKLMHLIVVRKDLQHFQHLHPTLDVATGEFTADINFPAHGPYVIYPDFTPAKSEGNPELVAISVKDELVVGDMKKYKAQEVKVDSDKEKIAKEYTVSYGLPEGDLQPKKDVTYTLNVTKEGSEQFIEPYLGARGHSVIIKKDTMQYIHTHALEKGKGSHHSQHSESEHEESMKESQIDFSTAFPEPGVYKIFTQFQNNGIVTTTEYVVEVPR